ncbi:fumarylacetoacetate hydrolase family protein [Streptomyces turgidiscabies]|uniref:FAH family protein n=1 Tax=Streptomyces turgidiscabies (strain Car8) TaxID=698760 RepID=L7FHW1_STRT8|nr:MULTISPECIES: fumarylacetoacetate hydrolase family protein [Streptomyces]ELP70300.1 FAH family protein [Streptomyces turgidiscabies Car8]MDX3496497.1 fumarylacetoacetate hydrolase family protein [Streptomyces turgidiscabies]GAQ72686.1 ureidoglycolate lyase [Streptomyces turgidiscabies]
MKFATFVHDGKRQSGIVAADLVHPFEHPVELLDLVVEGEASLREAGRRALTGSLPAPLAGIRLLPPLEPPSVRDYMTFESHVAGVAKGYGDTVPEEWYAAPAFYFTNPYAMIGAHDDVPVPPGCRRFDFELEVAAVIGKAGRDLTPEQAREHIIGYTILNDWSARDLQGREMKVKLGPAKGKDTATTLGPWLVTPDELEPHRDADGFLDLALTVEVNRETVGQDRLTGMAWTFEEMAAYASRGTWIRPGDVLGSGTCGNGGCLAELWGRTGVLEPPPLTPGDTVTMTVEGIGTISNTVAEGVRPVPLPPARRRQRS